MKILSILFFIFILFAIVSLIVWAISNMLNKNSNSSKKTFVQAESTTSEEIKELKTKKNISIAKRIKLKIKLKSISKIFRIGVSTQNLQSSNGYNYFPLFSHNQLQ